MGYFEFCQMIFCSMLTVAYYKCLWTKQHLFKDIIQSCPEVPFLPKLLSRKLFVSKNPVLSSINWFSVLNFNNFEFQMKVAAALFSFSEFLGILLIFLTPITGNVLYEGFSWTNPFKAFIQQGKYRFLLSNSSKLNSVEMEAFQFSPANICVGLGYAITFFLFLLTYNLMIGFCITAILTLWLCVNDFHSQSISCLESFLHEPNADKPEEHKSSLAVHNMTCTREREKLFVSILKKYTELKKLAWKINSALGELFLCSTFAICFFFAVNLRDIFDEQTLDTKLIIYHFLIKLILFCILSGDICQKVGMQFIHLFIQCFT